MSNRISPHSAAPSEHPLQGVLWMLASGLAFVAVNGTVRYLGTELPSAEGAFIRFAFGLLFLTPALVRTFTRGIPRALLPLIGLRGALHACAVILWFYAMARIPVAEVTAIGYMSPIVVTAGAALLLGERLALRRILAIVVALIGAAIVLRPGVRELQLGHLSQLGAATFFGLSYIVAKRLAPHLPASVLVALLSLTVCLCLLPVAVWVWVWPTAAHVAGLAIVAVFATLGHYFMARAFAVAPVSVTQPVTFLQIVWASILGAAAFGEAIDPYVILGAAIIIAAISYMSWREARIARAGATPPPDVEKF